jgi:hypothetical protein
MGIRTIVLLGTVLFFQLPQAIAAKAKPTTVKKNPVYIILEIADPEAPDGDVMTRMGQFIKALDKNIYAKDILLVVAESKEEITNQLKNQLRENDIVTGMLVTAHGISLKKDSHKESINLLNKETIKSMYSIIITSVSSHSTVDLLDTEETKNVFAPLLNKWSDNPMITFFSCSLLEQGNLNEKFIMSTIIADNLNIKRGQIYLNETDGTAMVRRLNEPAYGLPTAKQAIRQMGNHAIFFVTYPYAFYQDRVAANKGFRLVRTPETNYFYNDRYFNAEKATPALGPLVGTGKDEWFE